MNEPETVEAREEGHTVVAIHQPDFLPYPGFFNKMMLSDVFILYDTAQFSRRGYHNRNRIKTKRGPAWITVPVRSPGLSPIHDVEVDDGRAWPRQIWRALEVNYARAPHFGAYAPELHKILQATRWRRLVDLNVRLLEFVRDALMIETRIVRASDLPACVSKNSTEKLVELTRSVDGDVYLSGPGGRSYLDANRFDGVDLRYTDPPAIRYPQLWGPFAPNLSVADVLFNCGPEARTVVTGG